MNTETYVSYYRAGYLSRLIASERFSPAFLTEDLALSALRELLPARLYDRLERACEAIEEGYGFQRRGAYRPRKPKSVRRAGNAEIERLVDGIEFALRRVAAEARPNRLAGISYERKIVQLERIFELDEIEGEIVRFYGHCATDSALKDMLEDSTLESMRRDYAGFLGCLLGQPGEEIKKRISHGSRLRKMRVLQSPEVIENGNHVLELSELVQKILANENIRPDNLVESFYTQEPPATLSPDDFDHLEKELGMACRILADCWKRRRAGINILLYGPPGLGKTQLARLAGGLTGARTFSVPRMDDEGDVSTASERRISFDVFQRMCRGETRPLLIVDEAEGLLAEELGLLGGRGGEANAMKAWLTQALVENPLPVIWIVNHPDRIHDAVKRRFAYSVRFPELAKEVLARIWHTILERAGGRFQLETSQVQELVNLFELSPGHIAQAVETWRSTTGRRRPDMGDLRHILGQALRLYRDEEPRTGKLRELDSHYDPAILNASEDLTRIVARVPRFYELKKSQPGDSPFQMTVLLHGPPGSGKTEFAKYLGRSSGRTLQVERMSDLLSPWVGMSEKQIAKAFRRAADQGNILLIDEAEALIFDRQKTQKMWESSQINQFLQEIENYAGILIASTNLIENMDQAVVRRFAHKIKFEGIRAERWVGVVENYFSHLLPGGVLAARERAAIAALPSLFPGDLKAVRDRFQTDVLFGEIPTADTLVGALAHEAAHRKGEHRPIGFRPDQLN